MKPLNTNVKYIIPFLLLFVGLLFTGCQTNKNKKNQSIDGSNDMNNSNAEIKKESQQGWKVLFDGKSVEHWRSIWGGEFPEEDWKVENSMLVVFPSQGKKGPNGKLGGAGGSIVTKEKYSNFIFKLDFKLTKGANSGIKYFVVENKQYFKDNPNLSKNSGIGLEFQILDDKHNPDAQRGVNGNRTVSSLYDLIPADKDKNFNTPGNWNHAKIISKCNHVEHWLNGEEVVTYERGSDAFNALVDKSKYNIYENFGLASEGHILLQDHGTKVYFKNIKIKVLDVACN